MAIWSITSNLTDFMTIWYISSRFGILCEEKPGNPGAQHGQRV
jgi:hypothetical protein